MWPHGNEGEARVAEPDLPRESERTDFYMKYDFQMLATNFFFFLTKLRAPSVQHPESLFLMYHLVVIRAIQTLDVLLPPWMILCLIKNWVGQGACGVCVSVRIPAQDSCRGWEGVTIQWL